MAAPLVFDVFPGVSECDAKNNVTYTNTSNLIQAVS